MKITSNAGHSAKSAGASSGGLREHEVARTINAAFIAEVRARGLGVSDSTSNAATSKDVLNEQVAKANASGATVGVSHHLNAGGGTGFEVYYYRNSNAGKAYAEKISAALAKHYGLRNRGAKPDTATSHGSLRWCTGTKMPAVLIEWGFIDTPSDMKTILNDISGGVKATLNALGAQESTPAPKPAPVAPKPYTLKRVLRKGSTGSDVKKLQQALGFTGKKVDGDFGAITAAAVVKKQKAAGFSKRDCDGVVGKKTAKLFGWTWGV